MMNKYIIFIVIGLLFAACSQDDILSNKSESHDERVSLVINATKDGVTRVNSDIWEKTDTIGVTIFEVGDDTHPKASNLAYTMGTDGMFVPITNDIALGDQTFYLEKGKEYKVLAYYPWTNNISNEEGIPYIDIDLIRRNNLSKADLLTAQSSNNISVVNHEPQLLFKHTLMKLIIDIKPGRNVKQTDLIGLKAEAALQNSHVKLSLLNLKIKEEKNFNTYIPMKVLDNGTKAEVIIHPFQGRTKVLFTLKDKRQLEISIFPLYNTTDINENIGKKYLCNTQLDYHK